MRSSNYDKFPFIPVGSSEECHVHWSNIVQKLQTSITATASIICIECYPGVFLEEIKDVFSQAFNSSRIIDTRDYMRSPEEIDQMLQGYLTDDPVFGRMNHLRLEHFFNEEKLKSERQSLKDSRSTVFIIGTGATLITENWSTLIYADMARWEIQMRQRKNSIANLGAENFSERASLKYKRAFFVDWRVADRLKKKLLPRIDFLLDTNDPHSPKLISGDSFRKGLDLAVTRPFRVVPFFDPGPWGGQWMKKVCDLPPDQPNYAWCFDCVPEENSLLLGFGQHKLEIPSIDLVYRNPQKLLGDAVHGRFGTEFPIRFDFLDTMNGGNLSLQVHPLTEYIQEHFGVNYTQDESYYLLDADEDAVVYLGLKENIDSKKFIADLHLAQETNLFSDEGYVNKWPAKKHDHFLIPAGTIHCSGKNSMVLEISATPYIFTFKLWDWARLGLDGRPRPIHIDHGAQNIQWDRTTEWVKKNLINRIEMIAEGVGWREERTGLHEREFIETRRHWFTGTVQHNTNGNVNVLNLVEGEEVVVESPQNSFEPFEVHYAETFIVPAAVGPYTIRPAKVTDREYATIKAYVRT
jgi:mannose-6-phosphate isomerase class I